MEISNLVIFMGLEDAVKAKKPVLLTVFLQTKCLDRSALVLVRFGAKPCVHQI
jgi:hypothetical protein